MIRAIKHKPKCYNWEEVNSYRVSSDIASMETDLVSRSKTEGDNVSNDLLKGNTDSPGEKRIYQSDDGDNEFTRTKRSKMLSAEAESGSCSTNLIENDIAPLLTGNEADEKLENKTVTELAGATHPTVKSSDSESPGLQAIYHQDFEEDYNEESDEDWNDDDDDSGDNVSDDEDSHDGFFLGVNDRYNELEGNSGDEDEGVKSC